MGEMSCSMISGYKYETLLHLESRIAATNKRFKEFDLRVGDIVQHRRTDYTTGSLGGKIKLLERTDFKVISIYPNIFHCQAINKEGNWCESFKKIDYQLGEVVRLKECDERCQATRD